MSLGGDAVCEGLCFLYQICSCFIFLASTVPFAFNSASDPYNVLCLFLYSLGAISNKSGGRKRGVGAGIDYFYHLFFLNSNLSSDLGFQFYGVWWQSF